MCHFCCATAPGIDKELTALQTPGPKGLSALVRLVGGRLAGRGPHTQPHTGSPTPLCLAHQGQLEDKQNQRVSLILCYNLVLHI